MSHKSDLGTWQHISLKGIIVHHSSLCDKVLPSIDLVIKCALVCICKRKVNMKCYLGSFKESPQPSLFFIRFCDRITKETNKLVLLCPLIHMYARYFMLRIKNLKPARSSVCCCICSAVWTRWGKGVPFSGSLISYPANMQHLEQNYIQLSPTHFAETLQWQRFCLCALQVTSYFREGTTQVKTYWQPEKGVPWCFHPEVTER